MSKPETQHVPLTYTAVIFDLDGTLLDTLGDLAEAMNAVLAGNRLPTHPLEAYRYFVGDGMAQLVRRALPFEVADESDLNHFVTEMEREYRRRWTCRTRPYPGIAEMLAALRGGGLELAVLSNKPDAAVRHLVEALLPAGAFRRVLGAGAERPRKPDPAAALEIAAGLNTDPAAVVFVGDSAVDMQTAVRAGMFPAGVLWGFRPQAELSAAGAGRLFAQPADLPAWLCREEAGD
ncbi:MAG: HAD family hydrolase [Desulfobacterales bacterium]|nr:HAD family hydrolase [Desulfobacterales bacterium]